MKRSSAFPFRISSKVPLENVYIVATTKRTVPRSIEGHLLRRAKPLFSDVGIHYVAKGNCTWGHGFRSFILACFFSNNYYFVGVDLPAGIRGQGRRMANGSSILVVAIKKQEVVVEGLSGVSADSARFNRSGHWGLSAMTTNLPPLPPTPKPRTPLLLSPKPIIPRRLSEVCVPSNSLWSRQ